MCLSPGSCCTFGTRFDSLTSDTDSRAGRCPVRLGEIPLTAARFPLLPQFRGSLLREQGRVRNHLPSVGALLSRVATFKPGTPTSLLTSLEQERAGARKLERDGAPGPR